MKRRFPKLKPREKGWALLYTPRSGSTPLSRWLAGSLDCVYLEDYFNPAFRGLSFSGGKLEVRLQDWSKRASRRSIQETRTKWLKESSEIHFFKFNPLQLDGPELQWVLKNYRVLFCERQDLFEQLLSFLISWESRQWYVEGGIRVADASLVAARKNFDLFAQIVFEYERLKGISPRPQVFSYETFIPLGRERFLGSMGLANPAGTRLATTRKQNRAQKMKKFKNAAKILEWYRGSFLEALSEKRESTRSCTSGLTRI